MLNQARQHSAYLISSDYPPMSDMASHVIKCKPNLTKRGHYLCYVTPEAVAEEVKNVMAMDMNEKIKKAEAGHQKYLSDLRNFEIKMLLLTPLFRNALKDKKDRLYKNGKGIA